VPLNFPKKMVCGFSDDEICSFFVALQTMEVIPDPFWKYTGAICGTVTTNIPRENYI